MIDRMGRAWERREPWGQREGPGWTLRHGGLPVVSDRRPRQGTQSCTGHLGARRNPYQVGERGPCVEGNRELGVGSEVGRDSQT